MILDHVVILAIALVVIWALYRWGVVIFMIYAIVHFVLGQWDRAILAFCYAAFIAHVRAIGSSLDWLEFGRKEWRRACLRSRSRWLLR